MKKIVNKLDKVNEGWTWLLNSKKWHYFGSDGRSLCGRWMNLGNPKLEQGNDNSPDNCKACRKALLKKRLRTK